MGAGAAGASVSVSTKVASTRNPSSWPTRAARAGLSSASLRRGGAPRVPASRVGRPAGRPGSAAAGTRAGLGPAGGRPGPAGRGAGRADAGRAAGLGGGGGGSSPLMRTVSGGLTPLRSGTSAATTVGRSSSRGPRPRGLGPLRGGSGGRLRAAACSWLRSSSAVATILGPRGAAGGTPCPPAGRGGRGVVPSAFPAGAGRLWPCDRVSCAAAPWPSRGGRACAARSGRGPAGGRCPPLCGARAGFGSSAGGAGTAAAGAGAVSSDAAAVSAGLGAVSGPWPGCGAVFEGRSAAALAGSWGAAPFAASAPSTRSTSASSTEERLLVTSTPAARRRSARSCVDRPFSFAISYIRRLANAHLPPLPRCHLASSRFTNSARNSSSSIWGVHRSALPRALLLRARSRHTRAGQIYAPRPTRASPGLSNTTRGDASAASTCRRSNEVCGPRRPQATHLRSGHLTPPVPAPAPWSARAISWPSPPWPGDLVYRSIGYRAAPRWGSACPRR